MKKSKTYLQTKLSRKKRNAAMRGIECTLTIEDITALYQRNEGCCDYSGIDFSDTEERKKSTIERIDDKQGYVPGNICLVTKEVNSMKDSLLDKNLSHTIKLDNLSYRALAALRYKLSPEYLEHLKKKYIATELYERSKDKYLHYFKEFDSVVTNEIDTIQVEVADNKTAQSEIEQTTKITEEEENMIPTKKAQNILVPQIAVNREPVKVKEQSMATTQVESQEAIKEVCELPADVHIAGYYSSLARFAKKNGIGFDLSYSQFKASFGLKRCRFTMKEIPVHDKFIVLLDKNKPFTKENIALTSEQFGNNLNEVSEKMGMSISDMAKMFKRMK